MNPQSVINMINKIKKFDYDFIFASRYEKFGGSKDDTALTYIGNKIFTFLGNFLFKLKISDILFTYILGDTKKFKELNLINRDFRLCVEIPIATVYCCDLIVLCGGFLVLGVKSAKAPQRRLVPIVVRGRHVCAHDDLARWA